MSGESLRLCGAGLECVSLFGLPIRLAHKKTATTPWRPWRGARIRHYLLEKVRVCEQQAKAAQRGVVSQVVIVRERERE